MRPLTRHGCCHGRDEQIVQMLRTARKPTEHTAELWNGVPMPLVGAGTGAMVRAEVSKQHPSGWLPAS